MFRKENRGVAADPAGLGQVTCHLGWPLNMTLLLSSPKSALIKGYGAESEGQKAASAEYILT